MKLIIECTEQTYSECKKISGLSETAFVIANGTPYNPSGDCVSREALKKAIFEHCRSETECLNHFWYDENIIAIIDNAQTVDLWQMRQEATENALKKAREADKWNVINTEADLPKEDGFYLTTVEYVESISGELKRNTAELYFSTVFKSWSECGEDEDSDDVVIAWKPMPEPYTESVDV